MKKLLLAVLISGAALNAMAADTADLTVKGKLTSAACTPSFSDSGIVDFGRIYLGNLSKTAVNQLGVKTVTFTITCEGPSMIGVTNTDNRVATRAPTVPVENAAANGNTVQPGSQLFGIGMAGSVPLGAASIFLDVNNVKVDGVSKDTIYTQVPSPSSTSTWSNTPSGISTPGVRTFAFANTGTLIPTAGKSFIIPVKVSAAIQDTTTLAITDKVSLDGSSTFTVVYL